MNKFRMMKIIFILLVVTNLTLGSVLYTSYFDESKESLLIQTDDFLNNHSSLAEFDNIYRSICRKYIACSRLGVCGNYTSCSPPPTIRGMVKQNNNLVVLLKHNCNNDLVLRLDCDIKYQLVTFDLNGSNPVLISIFYADFEEDVTDAFSLKVGYGDSIKIYNPSSNGYLRLYKYNYLTGELVIVSNKLIKFPDHSISSIDQSNKLFTSLIIDQDKILSVVDLSTGQQISKCKVKIDSNDLTFLDKRFGASFHLDNALVIPGKWWYGISSFYYNCSYVKYPKNENIFDRHKGYGEPMIIDIDKVNHIVATLTDVPSRLIKYRDLISGKLLFQFQFKGPFNAYHYHSW